MLKDNADLVSDSEIVASYKQVAISNLTGVFFKQGGNHFDSCRFARAIWPDKNEFFTSANIKRDVIYRWFAVIAFR